MIQPLKMDLTEGSETSAKLNQTPGKYPKENIQKTVGVLTEIRNWPLPNRGYINGTGKYFLLLPLKFHTISLLTFTLYIADF
jgi:hypothetical protein